MTDFPEDTSLAGDREYAGSAVIIGTGSVGSYLAGNLADLGFSPLWLVDRDILEKHNVGRHYLGMQEEGDPKATALAKRLRDEHSNCDAFGEQVNFMDLDEDQQIAIIRRAPIVVAATDSLECQQRINELCVAHEVAAIYPGLWVDDNIRDGEVGYILPVVPEDRSPCFQCFTSWRPRVGDTEGRTGVGLDIKHFAGTVAWAVVSLLYPEDAHAETFDPDRPLTLVHSFASISPAIRHLFTSGNTCNLEFPFPRTPCPVCGGQETPPSQFSLNRPAPTIPRILPAAPLQTRNPRATSVSGTQGLGRVAAWLISGFVGLALLVIIISQLLPSSNANQQSTSTSVQSGSTYQPAPANTLPKTASTAFNVTPEFNARSATVSGSSGDSAGNNIDMSLTPSLRGFELTVQVSATYSASDLRNLYGSAKSNMASNCLDVATPPQDGMQGDTYYEGPLSTHLTSSGSTISGSMVYAAVLPGSYSFDLNCLNDSGLGQTAVVNLGSLHVSNIGGATGEGGTNIDNALAVYAEKKSSTDTVILYGAIGGYGDESLTNVQANTCIDEETPGGSPLKEWKSSHQRVLQRVSGISQAPYGARPWFQVGSLTFDVPASHAAGTEFYYGCSNPFDPSIYLR